MSVLLTEAQAVQMGHLAAVFGAGSVRSHDDDLLPWVWFRTEFYDWCIDEKGRVRGFNDVEEAA